MADTTLSPAKASTATAPRVQGPMRGFPTGRVLLYVVLLVAAVVAVVPFYWMISTSLMTQGETALRRWVPAVPQFQNYLQAWQQAQFNRYFMNSVLITLTTIIGMLVISVPAAYAFARIPFRGRNTVFTLLLVTLMIPEAVTLIPNYLLVSGNIVPLPLTQSTFPFLTWRVGNSWIDTLPALTVPFMGSAFTVFLLRQFFAGLPNELYDAARLDGLEHFGFLTRIVLPISRAPLATVTLLTFIGSWNAFLWPLIVTNGPRLRPITVGLQAFTEEGGARYHLSMAAALITILPILVLYFLTQKTFTEGIATTGLKG